MYLLLEFQGHEAITKNKTKQRVGGGGGGGGGAGGKMPNEHGWDGTPCFTAHSLNFDVQHYTVI